MAPFIGRPEVSSDESLELLDKATTELWMSQVAKGAAMSGTKTSGTNTAPTAADASRSALQTG